VSNANGREIDFADAESKGKCVNNSNVTLADQSH
jgi:hypothetical protein